MRLQNKVCLVTGAADGIGLFTSRAFAAQGARVALADIATEKARAEADAINKDFPGAALAISCDVTRTADVDLAVSSMVKLYGKIDVLVNNAAVAIGGRITELSDENWLRVIDTNLNSVFRGCRAVIPHMLRGAGGSIINMSSVQGHIGFDGWTAYATAKGGVMSMTRQLAKEFARHGIRINSVSPGAISTPLNFRRAAAEAPGREQEYLNKTFGHMHAMDRMGTPEEVASAIVFLASDESAFVTGVDLKVDGGLTLCPRLNEESSS